MTDYEKYRGKCKEMSEQLVVQDPTLTLVRGWYYDPAWGQQAHWWCVSPNGEVVDPTKNQFPSKGGGVYEPFDGMCECEECGKQIKEDGAIFMGRFPVCSTRCAMSLVGL
jgi:hypothetical protein